MTRQRTTDPDSRGLKDDHRTDLVHDELARLDGPAAVFFEKALAGDVAAAEEYLKIVDRKILLLAPDRTGPQH